MIDQHTFHARLAAWLDRLDAISPEGYVYEIDPPRKGQRYARIVQSILHPGTTTTSARSASRSVHAFYDLRTGDVYKAAGWKAPAKHIRFNLLDDTSFATMLGSLDWPGGYLYMR